MPDSFNIMSPSPDTRHTAHFVAAGEIRFGPLYFALSVGGYTFAERIFGDAHLWSSSSHLLAVQEWLTIDYSEGPITALVLIDLDLGQEVTVARATKGFLVPEAFADSILAYRTEYAGQGAIRYDQVDTSKIKDWNALV